MLMANGAIAKYGVALIARIVQITNRYPVKDTQISDLIIRLSSIT